MADLYALLFFGGITTTAMLVVFTLVQRVLAPEHRFRAEVSGTHSARALLHAGNLVAVFLMASSVVAGWVQGVSFAQDALWVAVFGAL